MHCYCCLIVIYKMNGNELERERVRTIHKEREREPRRLFTPGLFYPGYQSSLTLDVSPRNFSPWLPIEFEVGLFTPETFHPRAEKEREHSNTSTRINTNFGNLFVMYFH